MIETTINKLNELVNSVTTRDDLGEPTKPLLGFVDLKFMCPQCGYIFIGKEDSEVLCPHCKIPMIVKREENMNKLAESISLNVKKLRELVEQIDPTQEVIEKKTKSEQDDKEEPEKDDDKKDKEDKEEAKKTKSEQDDEEEPEKDDVEKKDGKEDEEPKKEKKEKKNEQIDGELEELPLAEPIEKEDDEEETSEQEESPKGEINLATLLDFLNSKIDVAYEITNAVFDQKGLKLTIALSPDLPPEVANMKDELADIFDVEPGDVKVTKSTVEVENVKLSLPESDDKEGFPGLKIKDVGGVKVHYLKVEGNAEDRLACPDGYKAEDNKCVPVKAKTESMSIKESFATLRKLI